MFKKKLPASVIIAPKNERKIKLVIRKIISLILLSSAVFVFFRLVDLFKIKKIDCITEYGACPTDLIAKVQNVKGLSIFFYDRSHIEKLVSNNIVKFEKKYPGTILIEIETPKAVARLSVKKEDKVENYLVTAKGQVLGIWEGQPLPAVYLADINATVGEYLSSYQALQGVDLTQKLLNLGFPEPQVSIKNEKIQITSFKDIEIYCSSHQNMAEVATTLQQLLGKATIRQNPPKRIDLSFKDPVITY